MSNIPLSIYHDTVEAANNGPLSSISSASVDEPDDHQIKNGSSQKQSIQRRVKNQRSKKDTFILRDSTNNVSDVQPMNTSIIPSSEISQNQLVPSVNDRFKELIEKGECEKIFELGEKMNNEQFLNQLCPVVKTLEQYNGIVDYLKRRKLVASFYVYGDIGVVKEAIVRSNVYDKWSYVNDGDLEAALPLALEKDSHDRFIKLLDVRMGITAENDDQRKLGGRKSSFEWFVYDFLANLAPWKDGMTLRRFLILNEDELKNKYRGIFDTFCETLVGYLSSRLHLSKTRGLLVDLIGQPLLLTPVVFAKEFLNSITCNDEYCSDFIKYGWRETIQEGLTTKYCCGGKKLWLVMQAERPNQFPGEFPVTEDERIAVCAHFPTKQQKEEEWYKECLMIFFNKLDGESISHIFPDVLWSIIFGYAVSLTFTEYSTVSAK